MAGGGVSDRKGAASVVGRVFVCEVTLDGGPRQLRQRQETNGATGRASDCMHGHDVTRRGCRAGRGAGNGGVGG